MNYRLLMRPDIENSTFEGSVSITVEISKPSDRIALNSKGLDITSCSVLYGASTIPAKSTQTDSDTIVLSLPKKVFGRATIAINFSGPITEKLRGFYRSTYNFNGTKEYMLTTQFEAADARRAFPCFDQPDMKATFNLSLEIDSAYSAVSNMPVSKERATSNGKKLVEFFATPIMSTYLLYFGIGKFEFTKSKYRGKTLRVVTVAGKQRYAQLPLEYLRSFLAFYESYFRIKFPLPKIDMIAVPDFEAGAMENWGAITFRETDLLCDEKSSVAIKQRVVTVIAHEMAHQWFGDLVTMKWWNDLWLNESFATFMSFKARDHEFPEWHAYEDFISDNIGQALVQDQLKATHPINVDVKTPGEIDALFDAISYQKGASVLNMVNDYVGEAAFRKGLNMYLKAHAYSNAAKEDLWDSLEKASKALGSGKRINYMMDRWVTKAGYPELRVSRKGSSISVKQNRSFLSKRMHSKDIWPVPVHYKLSKGSTGFMLIDKPAASISASDTQWAKLNFGQKGVYRVLYGEDMLTSLGIAAAAKKLLGIDSWGILNDLFYLVRSGRMALNQYVAYISKYMFDAGTPASLLLSEQLNFLYSLCYYESFSTGLKNAKQRFAELKYSELGWQTRPNDTPQERDLRNSTISSLGVAEFAPVVGKSNALFARIIAGKKVNPDIHAGIYVAAAWNGNAATFDKLVRLYKRTESQEEKRSILVALGMQKSPALIKKAFELSLSNEVRMQDSFIIPSIIAGSPTGRNYIWPWIRENWHYLMKKYPTTTLMLGRYVDSLSLQSDPAVRKEIAAFFANRKNMRDDIKKSVPKVLEKIDANIEFMKTNS